MSSAEHDPVEDREIVAVRTEEVRGHEHIVLVKLASGETQDVATVRAAIEAHEAHYVMAHASGLPLIVQTGVCPDCNEPRIWA